MRAATLRPSWLDDVDVQMAFGARGGQTLSQRAPPRVSNEKSYLRNAAQRSNGRYKQRRCPAPGVGECWQELAMRRGLTVARWIPAVKELA